MQFNSFIFLLLFLPLSLIGYYAFNRVHIRLANFYLICMSLWFYGYFNPYYLAIIGGSVFFNYICGTLMSRDSFRHKKPALIFGLVFNIGLIFVFKYYDFFTRSINGVFGANFGLLHLVLPLGISFFTFQQISYLVDSYHGETKGYRFDEYALFVVFFPQLVAGPIVLHSEMIPQIRSKERRIFDWDSFSTGIMMFTIGLFKKMEIADTFGRIVDWGFANPSGMTSLDTALVMISYTFQIYFDFSGYSDMAIGLGKMFHFDIPQNFDSPYRSVSAVEFWKRWHLTLTRFLRSYVYYPLGGNRKGIARTYLNIMIVFLISGLWHGANWTFILWGLLHGVAQVLNRTFEKPYSRFPTFIKWILTFGFVNVLWLLFRADSVSQWIFLLKKMFQWSSPRLTVSLTDTFFTITSHLCNILGHPGAATTVFSIVIVPFLAIVLLICLKGKNIHEMKFRTNGKTLIVTAFMLFVCIISFSRESIFIYFNF